MTTKIPSKTYSCKRRRALSDLTDGPSSPSPAAPTLIKDIPEVKKRKLTVQQRTASRDSEDSGSPEDVSSKRSSKRLKRHSSPATTPVRISHPVLIHTALAAISPAVIAQPVTESPHRVLLTRKKTDHQPLSTSSHVKTTASSVHQHPQSDLNQPDAFHDIPFRRTRSQTHKENLLACPQALGSPFQIAATLPSSKPHPSGTKATRQFQPSKFHRRPSADAFRAHTSHSAAFRRRPSGSHVLQKKSTENRDWLIPLASRIPLPADENNAPFYPDIDLNRSYSLFSPQGSSTPLPPRRSMLHGTPKTPASSVSLAEPKLSPRHEHDIVMNDATPIPEQAGIHSPAAAHGHHNRAQAPHRIVHLPHDSIFSSFDVSASPTTVQGLANSSLCHAVEKHKAPGYSPSRLSSGTDALLPVSEGDKLHDMFSVLELAEQTKQGPSGDSGIEIKAPQASSNTALVEGPKSCVVLQHKTKPGSSKGVVFKENSKNVRGARTATIRKRQKEFPSSCPSSSSSSHQNLPKQRIKVNADNEPLVLGDDEDDELLLTSKGWDWDPQ